MNPIYFVIGIAILLLGRKLYWLFVGAIGFLSGLNIAPLVAGDLPGLDPLLVGVALGLICALLAVFLQRLAIAVAGFLAGAYIGLIILGFLEIQPNEVYWVLLIAGGILGAVLIATLFDRALVVLSALLGAVLIVQDLRLDTAIAGLLFFGLVVVGISVQFRQLHSESGAPSN